MIPADAKLTPRDPAFPAWDSVPADLKKLYARQMEVFAGFQENCDHEIGRVVQSIEDLGIADNTLIIYIWGDNGSSMEGTETGTFNEMTTLNGIDVPAAAAAQADRRLRRDRRLGRAEQPAALRLRLGVGRQHARSSGASRWPRTSAAPATRWSSPGPGRIKDKGGLRAQFTHVIDIVPTILEAAGIPPPKEVNGIEQMPMHGVSFAYTFDDARAKGRHTQQYFEIFGNRAMYKDGWIACARLDRIPWKIDPAALAKFGPEGRLGPGQGQVGALQHRRGLLPGERPGGQAPGEAGRAEEAVLGGGREIPRHAADGRARQLLRLRGPRRRSGRGSPTTPGPRTSARA